jgi:hypothetical protein
MENELISILVPLGYMLGSIKAARFWFRYYDWHWKQDRITNAIMSLGVGLIWPLVIMLFFVLAPTPEERKEIKKQNKITAAALRDAEIAKLHHELGMSKDDDD